MNAGIPELEVYKFRLALNALDSFSVPEYKGSMFRGAFGWSFKKAVCIMNHGDCAGCMIAEMCAYASIFETELNAGHIPYLRGIRKVPHPFVLHPPEDDRRTYQAGEELDLGLTLFGTSVKFLPYFIIAVKAMGNAGIGKDRGKFALREAFSVDWKGAEKKVYDGGTDQLQLQCEPLTLAQMLFCGLPEVRNAELTFHTPFRYQEMGKVLRSKTQITARKLFVALERRYFSLCGLFGSGEFPEEITFDDTLVRLDTEGLYFFDWERYSARQEQRMSLGGFMGTMRLSGDLRQILPFLLIGSYINIGKNTVFGLGGYTLKLS